MIKISFIGDLLCEEPFLHAAKKEDGSYDFHDAFTGMKAICAASDYVIGNLETPFVGSKQRLTHEMYRFNSPDSFVDAVKDMGVSMVLTANNHCLDCGPEGIDFTLDLLDQKGLPHTGTYRDQRDTVFFTEVKGCRVAVISCTAGTNGRKPLYQVDTDRINYLCSEEKENPFESKKRFVQLAKRFVITNLIGQKNWIRVRKRLGRTPKNITYDDDFVPEREEPYIRRICGMIQEAKEHADVVFVCPHMGGQFNVRVGRFSEYAMQRLVDAGADAVVAGHPHVIQKAEYIRGVPCFYSISNVSMSMSTLYILKENLPEYGLMTHFYLADGKIEKVSFSFLKILEEPNGFLHVLPVYDLYVKGTQEEKKLLEEHVDLLLKRIYQTETLEARPIQKEYEF